MGGMHCFGKVEPEPEEPVFHAPWEGRVLAMNLHQPDPHQEEEAHCERRP